MFSNKSGKSVVLDNVSIAFGNQSKIQDEHFGFFTDRSALIDFGAETKLITSGTKYVGVESASSKLQLQGNLVVEGGSDNEIVGIKGSFVAIQPLTLQINSQYTNTITGITGGNLDSGQPIELQIDAQNSIVTAIKDKSISERINITKFIAKEGSYILKNTSSYSTISVGNIPTTKEEQNSFAIYSDLEGAKYAFMQSSNFDSDYNLLKAQDTTKNYYGFFAKQNFRMSGNVFVNGATIKSLDSVKNLAGVYVGGDNGSSDPLTLTIEDNTNLKLKGHSSYDKSGVVVGILADGRDIQIEIEQDKMFAMRFYQDGGQTTEYIGFDIKNATLTMQKMSNGQKIVFDTFENVNDKHSKKTTIMRLNNGNFSGELDLYVEGEKQSSVLAFNQIYGLYTLGNSNISGRILLKNGVFKDVINQVAISGKYSTAPITFIYNENSSTLTFKPNSLFYSEAYRTDDSTDSGVNVGNNNYDARFLIKNYGAISFEIGAKAVFGQEYSRLDEILYDGIYIAPYPQNKTTKILTSSMTFKGNAGISVASGATLNMTLSSGTLEFNGSNGSQEMVAFNALQSSDTSVAQGKINLAINQLNSSIIFTKAQGGVLETFKSLVSNPISSASTDKNTIVNLAGIAQDSSQSREVEGKLATRSLTIKNANIKNVNFITYVNPNISTSNVGIANFDGRAYSNPSGGVASFGASDRIIIENSLENSGNNTFSIAIAPNQSTKNMSGYMLIGKVKTSSNLIFNNLKNNQSQNITAYSGLRTTTLTLHRSDVGGYSYYYVTSAQDSTTPTPPPSGGGSTGGGEVGGGGSGGEITPPEGGNGGGGVIPPIGGGDNENNGNNGQTPPPSNDNNTSVGDDVIDVPNVGVAPLTRSAFKTNFTLVSSTLNSLNKRLGDIRSLENADGVWARVFVGEEVFKDALQTNAIYSSVQAGYDHAIELENDTDFVGFALAWVGSDTKSQEDSYQVSPIDFINGKNTIKTNGVELALYNSYLSHLGLYTDSIIKFGYYSSDVSMPMMENFALDDFSFSLSQEVGYQARLGEKKEWVITPQVEIAYAFITGSEATQNLLMAGVDNVMDISQSASHLLRMRAGVDWGYSFDGWSEIVSKADIHLGTSYEYDVISGGDMTYSLPDMGTYKEKGMDSNGRFVLNIGTNIYIKETASIYFDFEKSFGDTFYKNYQANLGARFSFGEKIHKLQDEKTQSAPLSIPSSQQSDMQDKN